MRISPLVLFVSAIFVFACEDGVRLPTTPVAPPTQPPAPPTSNEVYLHGVVYDNSNTCVAGATVELRTAGETRPVMHNDCTRDPHGFAAGYIFKGLLDGQTVVIRAARDGYLPQEHQLIVDEGMDGVHEFNFFLQKE